MARRRKPTVWEALNEPIIHLTENQAKDIIFAAVTIMFAAWVAPYWTQADNIVYFAPENVFEQFAQIPSSSDSGMVAGAQIVSGEEITPEWYYVMEEMPDAIVESFANGANEVLDISGPVGQMAEFYQPGVDALLNEWLNLMRDPGTPSF